ncbi:NUDIX hydrolase [Staphylospora marina]|uniref:NUDIX hydrolase n=1 Tax=Staphylospora marina TaxID=2490858 RepID=UPI0019D13CB6|nr:NUDIX domain-containing protein [Staphylospora marina]
MFCRHKNRRSWESPGGRRETGESVLQTARRELYEETGAVRYELIPVSPYRMRADGEETCGMLFFAEIHELSGLPGSEIAEVRGFDGMPESLTYRDVQATLMERVMTVVNRHFGPSDGADASKTGSQP